MLVVPSAAIGRERELGECRERRHQQETSATNGRTRELGEEDIAAGDSHHVLMR
jgi:hypothetical protein